MELRLGRFGDRRLKKGGPFFWAGWWNAAAVSCGYAGWAGIVRERFG
jgi:hypothetical protein